MPSYIMLDLAYLVIFIILRLQIVRICPFLSKDVEIVEISMLNETYTI